MRALLVVSVYITAMLVAAGGASYVSLRLAEAQATEVLEPGTQEYVAEQLSLLTWGLMAGALCFVAVHALGFTIFRNRLEEENPLPGLWLQFGASALSALLGGVIGATIAG